MGFLVDDEDKEALSVDHVHAGSLDSVLEGMDYETMTHPQPLLLLP